MEFKRERNFAELDSSTGYLEDPVYNNMRSQLNQSYLCKIINSRTSLVDEQFESWFNSKYFKAEVKESKTSNQLKLHSWLNLQFEEELHSNRSLNEADSVSSINLSINHSHKKEFANAPLCCERNNATMITPSNIINCEANVMHQDNMLPNSEQRLNGTESKGIKEFDDKAIKTDFSKRFDVVNKTLVRSIKRYYSDVVGTISTKNYDLNSQKVLESCMKIDEICESKFSNRFPPEIIANSYPLHELLTSKCKYLCSLKEQSSELSDNTSLSCKPKAMSNWINSVFANSPEELKFDVQLYHEIKILIAFMVIRVCMK